MMKQYILGGSSELFTFVKSYFMVEYNIHTVNQI